MATTDFLQFNNPALNQQTDAEYLADSTRAGGFGTDAIVPSPLLNKILYQSSTFIAAFGQMMAAKGYNTSDADISVLAAVLANIITSADQLPNILTIGFSPTPAFNFALTNGYQMTLSGNITSSTASGLTPGQLIAFYFVQDGVGGRTVTFPASFTGGSQPDPTASVSSVILFRVDLGGTARAVTPFLSVNGTFGTSGTFSGNVSVGSLQIGGVAPASKILVGDGTHYSPQDYLVTRNANGTFMKTPDGAGGFIYEAWGIVNAPATGGRQASVAITFPLSFPGVPVLVVAGGSSPAVGHNDSMTVYSDSISASGATAWLNCAVNIGGSGAPGLNSSVPVHWHAKY